jgi:hypothetical protein
MIIPDAWKLGNWEVAILKIFLKILDIELISKDKYMS